jgi:hypothetical protein
MSGTSSRGLPMVSTNQAFVLSSVASTKPWTSVGSMKDTSMPSLLNVCRKMFQVPPYSEVELTMLSPEPARLSSARFSAACPDETASAAEPPCRPAMRCSRTSLVGFMMRE